MFSHSSVGKSSACNAGDLGLIPGLGRSPGEGNGNSLQNSCLENPMDKVAWRATVHGVVKSWTQPLTLSCHFPVSGLSLLESGLRSWPEIEAGPQQ